MDSWEDNFDGTIRLRTTATEIAFGESNQERMVARL